MTKRQMDLLLVAWTVAGCLGVGVSFWAALVGSWPVFVIAQAAYLFVMVALLSGRWIPK